MKIFPHLYCSRNCQLLITNFIEGFQQTTLPFPYTV